MVVVQIIILGFFLRLLFSAIWLFNKKDDFGGFVPTKKQALKFYLIPFYWVYWVCSYYWNEVFE